MLRPRPEPSDLAASLVPRMGDTPFAPLPDRFRGWARRPLPAETLSVGGPTPFAPRVTLADPAFPLRPGSGFSGPRAVVVRVPRDPAREAADAAEQQAIADAVEGVIP